MSALPNVLMTQNNPRPASPAAAGLKLASDGISDDQGRSFEDTLSDQTDVNLDTKDSPAEPETVLTAELPLQVSENDIAGNLNSSLHSETEGLLDRTGVTLAENLPPEVIDIPIPLGETPTTIPTSNIATLINPEAAPLAFVAAGDPIPTAVAQASAQQPNAPQAQPTVTPLAALQTLPTPTETDASQIEGAVLPKVTPAAPDTVDIDAKDAPRLSERAAETAEYRALVKPSASTADLAKIADAPAQPTTVLTGSDAPTPLKPVPVIAPLPTLTPIAGMSDRLAATILQTANAQPTVTMDKLPQAVVAIALSAKSATLQIDPPELGRIQLDYQFDNQGRTVVTLTPESEAARAALLDRMASITAALEQGSNNPVDVKLGDARDFGSEFGQASQDSESSNSAQKDGANGPTSDTTQTDDLQRFMRAPLGEAERLHILV